MTTAHIQSLRRTLAMRANQVLAETQRHRDERPREEWSHPGGICHLIADMMADVLIDEGIDAILVDAVSGVEHTYVIACGMAGDAVQVDVPYSVYEVKMGPFMFELIPEATISPEDIVIDALGEPFSNFASTTER